MKNWARTAGRYLRDRYVLLILGAWLVFLMEFLSRTSATDTMQWSYQHLSAFLFNMLLLTGLLLLFSGITGRIRWAYWIVFVLAFALSLVSGIKMKILGVPVLPWDLALTGEGADMTQYIKTAVNLRTGAGILVFVGASVGLLYYVPGIVRRIRGWERAVLAGVSLLLISGIFFSPTALMKGVFGIEEKTWNQRDNILSNGLLLSTLLNFDHINVNKVEGTDAESIEALVRTTAPSTEPVKAGDPSAPASDNDKKPNIIVVLSEAFWDPTVNPNVKFSRDPIPNFHRLASQYPSGWFLSPQYGGGTANVEFEVLTGNSMRFLPEGSVAYNQFINRPVDSLAAVATREGYTATAVSPFYNWFFNSDKVYRYFGFSKFISLEFFNQKFVGPYMGDDEVANNIINESKKTPGPDMIFANTMENHFHFWPGKFKENTIEVTGAEGNAKGFLETLAQGISDADLMLQKLVDYYTESKEPTILLFFGDHLPALGDDYQGYVDSKWISGPKDPDFLTKMYKTPMLVWNNYMPAQKEDLFMSPAFMYPYLIEKANLKGNYYSDFLNSLYKKMPVFPPHDYYGKFNVNEADTKDYEKLQYDILFGEQHGYAAYKDSIMAKSFVLGLGELALTKVDASGDNGQAVKLTLEGANFPELSQVTLNGKPLETQFIGHEKLTATVPAAESLPGTWDVAVRVMNNKDEVIAETPVVKLERP